MEKTEVINKTEKPNSFCGRYGSGGTDFKIYFETEEDLKKGLEIIETGKKLVEGWNK